MKIQGIDVSYFQGKPDWKRVKKSGIKFAMLRAGYGKNHVDKEFKRNAKKCNQVGLPFGVYWFSYAYTEKMARKEAEYCVAAIKKYKVEYPVCVDFEGASVEYARKRGVKITPSLATKIVEAFCERVEELGYFAMYYSNEDYLKNMFKTRLREKYALWYAKYAKKPGKKDIAMWQYRNNGRVDGIRGNVDRNIAVYDIRKVIARNGLNHLGRGRL